MPDEPWDHYGRDVLPSGWSYPVGRQIVEASLRATGVHLLSLDFSRGCAPASTDTTVLRAWRFSDIGTSYHVTRGTPERPRSTLTLYAVRGETRAHVGMLLTGGGILADACAWLAAAERASPTWLDKTHTWDAYLHRDKLLVAQSEH